MREFLSSFPIYNNINNNKKKNNLAPPPSHTTQTRKSIFHFFLYYFPLSQKNSMHHITYIHSLYTHTCIYTHTELREYTDGCVTRANNLLISYFSIAKEEEVSFPYDYSETVQRRVY